MGRQSLPVGSSALVRDRFLDISGKGQWGGIRLPFFVAGAKSSIPFFISFFLAQLPHTDYNLKKNLFENPFSQP